MNGILWFDADKKTTLEEKLKKALEYHRHKFERDAQIVMIHAKVPEGVDLEAISKALNVIVKPISYVTPNHFWVGFEDQVKELANG